MTEAKHTTGPWTVGSSTGHNACHVYCGDDSICTVYAIFAHQSVEQVADDPRCAEGMANARLIAAAPDMLRIVEVFLGHDARFQVAVGGNPLAVDKMLADASDVYAKATGAE